MLLRRTLSHRLATTETKYNLNNTHESDIIIAQTHTRPQTNLVEVQLVCYRTSRRFLDILILLLRVEVTAVTKLL